MYCSACKKYVPDGSQECPYCKSKRFTPYAPYQQNKSNDESSAGFAILSFLIPIIGIVLYFVWKNDYPKKASSCIKGAVISIVLSVITILLTTCGTCALLGSYGYY